MSDDDRKPPPKIIVSRPSEADFVNISRTYSSSDDNHSSFSERQSSFFDEHHSVPFGQGSAAFDDPEDIYRPRSHSTTHDNALINAVAIDARTRSRSPQNRDPMIIRDRDISYLSIDNDEDYGNKSSGSSDKGIEGKLHNAWNRIKKRKNSSTFTDSPPHSINNSPTKSKFPDQEDHQMYLKVDNSTNTSSSSSSSNSSPYMKAKMKQSPNLTLLIPNNNVDYQQQLSSASPRLSPHSASSSQNIPPTHKVTEEEIDDMNLALNDALKSALNDKSQKVETTTEQNNELRNRNKATFNKARLPPPSPQILTTSYQQQPSNDLELGSASMTEIKDDIELQDMKQTNELTVRLGSSSDSNYKNLDNDNISLNQSINSKSYNQTFKSVLKKVTRNINADDDSTYEFDNISNNDEASHLRNEYDYDSTYSSEDSDLESLITTYENLRSTPRNDSLNPFSSNVVNQADSHNSEDVEIPKILPPLFGKSLKLFSPDSRVRLMAHSILTNNVFQSTLSFLIFFQTGLLSYEQFSTKTGYVLNKGYTWVDWVLAVIYLVYTADVILKSVAFGFYDDSQMFSAMKVERCETLLERYYHGFTKHLKSGNILSPKSFIKSINVRRKYSKAMSVIDEEVSKQYSVLNREDDDGLLFRNHLLKEYMWNNKDARTYKVEAHRAFLRNDWNRVDFVSIICFWISFFLAMASGSDIGKCQMFRSLMCLKILRLLNFSSSSRMVLRGIQDAMIQSKQVIGFLLCFWILMSIIGVESFKSSFRRQCVWVNPLNSTDTYINEFQFCGSHLDPKTLEKLPYLNEAGQSSGVIKGFTCPAYSECRTGENPYGESLSFDNIVNSMEIVFVIMSANTFTDIMYYTMDSDNMASSLFFIISILILVVWLLNLVIAVVIHSYKEMAEKKKKNNPKPSFWKRITIEHDDFFNNSSYFAKLFKKGSTLFVLVIFFNFAYGSTKTVETRGEYGKQFNIADFISSCLLLSEIALRFLCYTLDKNPLMFFKSIFNLLDFSLGLIDFIITLPPVYNSLGATLYGWLSFFVILRFYRVIYWFPFLRRSWSLVFNRFLTLIKMTLFALVFIFLIGVIVSRLFEGIVPEDEMSDQPWIMNNLPNTILSLYIITSTENWTMVLYSTQEHAKNNFTKICISVYLLGWFFLSNTVLLSIFIAVITDGMEFTFSQKARYQLEKFIADCISKLNETHERGLVELFKAKLSSESGKTNIDTAELLNHVNSLLKSLGHEPVEPDDYREKSGFEKFSNLVFIKRVTVYINKIVQFLGPQLSKFTRIFWKPKIHLEVNDQEDPFADQTDEHLLLNIKIKKRKHVNRSLMIFPNGNPIRTFCQKLISPAVGVRTEGAQPEPWRSMFFTGFMFVFSIVVVVFACYITPLYKMKYNPERSSHFYAYYVDIGFMAVFTVEFFIKVIADGYCFGRQAYMKSFWNFLDFIVLLSFWTTSMAIIAGYDQFLTTFGGLRALRAFRLLTITRVSLWNFEAAIVGGAKQILSAAFISLSLLLPFSLWGLNIFMGRLTVCSNGSSLDNCFGESTTTVGKWNVLGPNYNSTPALNFDTFQDSFRSLFEIISLEGWTDILTNVMQIVKPDEEAGILNAPYNAIFLVLFNFCSIVFILNFFVSVIIHNYAQKTGSAFLSDLQHSWYHLKKILQSVKPSRRNHFSNMSETKIYLNKILMKKDGIVNKILNLIFFVHFMILVTEYYPSNIAGDAARHAIFIITTGLLLLHTCLLIYSLGFKLFFANKWNIVRFVILSSSFCFNILAFFVFSGSSFINFDKAMLVIVLLFVIPRVDTLNQLVTVASASVTALFWLLYTWLVLYLVFAIVLNQVFGLTRIGENTSGNLNLRTVTKSLILLFRSSFGEAWNYTMLDMTVQDPYCSTVNGHSDCGNQVLAQLIFMLWNILSMYVFLNILISVVINNFSYVYQTNGEHKLITREEVRKFKRQWNKLDPDGSGYIDLELLPKFLHSLDGVLSFHVYPPSMRINDLTKKWTSPSGTFDPYNVTLHYDVINDHFALCNFKAIRKRKQRYTRMCIEIEENADAFEDIHGEITYRVSFKSVILAVGFYSRYKNSDCLVIADRVKYNYNIRRIQRIINARKNIAAAKMVYTRLQWTLLFKNSDMKKKLENTSSEERKKIKEDIRQKLRGGEIDYTELMNSLRKELDDNDQLLAVGGTNLSRIISNTSMNPFNDVYQSGDYIDDPFDDSMAFDDEMNLKK